MAETCWVYDKRILEYHLKLEDMMVSKTVSPTWWTQSRNCRKTGVKPLLWLPSVCAPRWLNLCPNDSHSFSTSSRKPSKVL